MNDQLKEYQKRRQKDFYKSHSEDSPKEDKSKSDLKPKELVKKEEIAPKKSEDSSIPPVLKKDQELDKKEEVAPNKMDQLVKEKLSQVKMMTKGTQTDEIPVTKNEPVVDKPVLSDPKIEKKEIPVTNKIESKKISPMTKRSEPITLKMEPKGGKKVVMKCEGDVCHLVPPSQVSKKEKASGKILAKSLDLREPPTKEGTKSESGRASKRILENRKIIPSLKKD